MRSPTLAILLVVAAAAPRAAGAQDDETTYSEPSEGGHLNVIGWGGTLPYLGSGSGSRPAAPFAGGEVSWSFSSLDLGVLAQGYKLKVPEQSQHEWTPVLLLRVEQRFETRRNLDAVLAIGLGGARTATGGGWEAWYQFAFGMRLGFGPIFVAGEVGFEQLNLLRLAAGLGVRI